MIFKRTLTEPMIQALNTEYENGGWWKNLADDKETLIAIRDQYLNVYRNGCSIAKVGFKNGELLAETHYKYLLTKNFPQPYIKCKDGEPQFNAEVNYFISSIGQIDDLRTSTNIYGGQEKMGVHKIILANENIVDTEIALSGNESEDEDSRIDFCAIKNENGKLFLRFFEAKHYSYKGALRTNDGDAKVIGQLDKYSATLDRNHNEILSAYKESIRLAGAIKGTNILGKELALYNLDSLEIDIQPRLIVFGFDADQKHGSIFKIHMDKLKEKIQSRLLLKGDASNFALGISK
ncbi:MAG: hypothetical protein HHJ09_00605 [Glaciimonas sp.]|nr:hypothetical protein [Glaciimonas sp.]